MKYIVQGDYFVDENCQKHSSVACTVSYKDAWWDVVQRPYQDRLSPYMFILDEEGRYHNEEGIARINHIQNKHGIFEISSYFWHGKLVYSESEKIG